MGEYYGVRMKDDPDGEYLQHWGLPKGFMRKAHKYLARLVTPSGYRYIYNQAQLAAAKAGKAIGDATGWNQRNRAQNAKARAQRISGGNKGREQSVQGIKRARMAKATAKRAQSEYDRTPLGRVEGAFNSARKTVSDAVNRPLRNAIGSTATMKRIDKAQKSRARNDRRESIQQERVTSVRGGSTYNDHFNKERPVTAKSASRGKKIPGKSLTEIRKL